MTDRPIRLVPNDPSPEFFTEWLAPTELDDESCGPGGHDYVEQPLCRKCGSLLHPEEPA